jgi:hypothetical protein
MDRRGNRDVLRDYIRSVNSSFYDAPRLLTDMDRRGNRDVLRQHINSLNLALSVSHGCPDSMPKALDRQRGGEIKQ